MPSYSDSFDRPDANPISGGSWVVPSGAPAMQILSNAARASADGSRCKAYWSDVVDGQRQYSEIVVDAMPQTDDNNYGILLCVSEGTYGGQGHLARFKNNSGTLWVEIHDFAGTSETFLAYKWGLPAVSGPTTFRFERRNDLLILKRDGAVILWTATQRPSYSGKPGIYSRGTGASGAILSWAGGDIEAVSCVGVPNTIAYPENIDLWSQRVVYTLADQADAPVTPTGGGTWAADKVCELGGFNMHSVQTGIWIVAGQIFTLSFYAKAAERQWVLSTHWYSGEGTPTVAFNLATGAIWNGSAQGIYRAWMEDAGNGWKRCIIQSVPSISGGSIYIGPDDGSHALAYQGTAGYGIYLWGVSCKVTDEVCPYPDPLPPSPPSAVSAAPGNRENTVSFASVPGATSYNLYFRDSPGVTKQTGTKIAGIASPFLHQGLDNLKTYYYVVTAENANGEGAESAEVFAAPYYSAGGSPNRIWTLPRALGRLTSAHKRLLLHGAESPVFVVPVPTYAGKPRTPIALVLLHLDYCGRVFGVAPCLAVGTPCYNTWKSCRYLPAFLATEKVYKFSLSDAPLPFDGVRPYVRTVHLLPTEIKTNLTVSARVTVEFTDDLDFDVGTDPYVRSRPAGLPRSYFKRLLARNPNYKGRLIEIFEGFLGEGEGEFKKKWVGHLENVTLCKGVVKIESVDLLKNLSKIEVPPKLDLKLSVDLSAAQTGGMTLSSVEGLDDSGYVRIGDEIVGYATRDAATKQLLTLTRGAFATTAAEHKTKEKVQKVRYFAPANPWDILLAMLRVDAGISDDYIDLDAFSYFRDWPGGDVDFSAVISEPEKLDTLFMEVVDLLDAKAWVAEDLRITVRRNIQNEPGRSYRVLSDEAHHVHKTMAVDLNEKSRLTRMFVYWGKKAIGKHEEPSSYDRLDIAIDADAEGAYGEAVEKKSYCRWISSSYLQEETAAQYVKNIAMRRVRRNRDAQPIIAASLDLKDADVKTGEFIRVSTDEVADLNGAPVLAEIFQVVKREHKGTRVNVSLLRLSQRKVAFIAPAGTPSFSVASDQQKEYGFITVADGRMPDESPGYHIW